MMGAMKKHDLYEVAEVFNVNGKLPKKVIDGIKTIVYEVIDKDLVDYDFLYNFGENDDLEYTQDKLNVWRVHLKYTDEHYPVTITHYDYHKDINPFIKFEFGGSLVPIENLAHRYFKDMAFHGELFYWFYVDGMWYRFSVEEIMM